MIDWNSLEWLISWNFSKGTRSKLRLKLHNIIIISFITRHASNHGIVSQSSVAYGSRFSAFGNRWWLICRHHGRFVGWFNRFRWLVRMTICDSRLGLQRVNGIELLVRKITKKTCFRLILEHVLQVVLEFNPQLLIGEKENQKYGLVIRNIKSSSKKRK